jgi:hypothetical protein
VDRYTSPLGKKGRNHLGHVRRENKLQRDNLHEHVIIRGQTRSADRDAQRVLGGRRERDDTIEIPGLDGCGIIHFKNSLKNGQQILSLEIARSGNVHRAPDRWIDNIVQLQLAGHEIDELEEVSTF